MNPGLRTYIRSIDLQTVLHSNRTLPCLIESPSEFIMSSTGKHALVFGASGISGWSLLNQCLSYPTPSTFRRVTGLCNRPLNKDNALLPDDSRLNIVHGIDLTGPVDVVIEQLKTKVKEVQTIDVVFFCGKFK